MNSAVKKPASCGGVNSPGNATLKNNIPANIPTKRRHDEPSDSVDGHDHANGINREESIVIIGEVNNMSKKPIAVPSRVKPPRPPAAAVEVADVVEPPLGSNSRPVELDDEVDCTVLICSDHSAEKIDMEQGSLLAGIPDWKVLSTLGDGAYGDVKLVRHVMTQELRACKIIKSEYTTKYAEDITREIKVQQVLQHERVVQFVEHKKTLQADYLFLEYIPGGELFDRISPDFGMPEQEAQRLFRQLIECVEYMHSRGVVHRDIKPENLLLDGNDNLKITDFGFASVFRGNDGQVRKVRKRCGTLPYTAPEVFRHQQFDAEPLDVWSCGVVLIAMLTGELPWDKPQDTCEDFVLYTRDKYFGRTPWNRLSNPQLQLITGMMHLNVARRWSLLQIRNSRWFTLNFAPTSSRAVEASAVVDHVGAELGQLHKRLRPSTIFPDNNNHHDGQNDDDDVPQTFDGAPSYSIKLKTTGGVGDIGGTQPANISMLRDEPYAASNTACAGGRDAHMPFFEFDGVVDRAAFSQPAQKFEHMVLSQLGMTQQGTRNGPGGKRPLLQNLARRMTRFFVRRNMRPQEAFDSLRKVCEELHMTIRNIPTQQGQLTIATKDQRKNDLSFKVMLIDIKGRLFFDFRLSKGDGIEFKRKFVQIKEIMKERGVVDEYTPVSYMAVG